MANETTLNMILKLRRDNTFVSTYKLEAGEPGFEISTNTLKIGQYKKDADGNLTTQLMTWAELPIANKSQIDTLISDAISAHAAGYYTKSEIDDIKTVLQQATAKVASDLAAETTAREAADTELQTQINTKLTATDFTGWKTGHENDHAGTATEITAEITAAVNGEKALREAADNAINAKLGTGFDDGNNTVAKKIAAAETAAKSHAESQASTAYTNAVAEAEAKDVTRATAAATALSEAKTELEGKISGGDSATLQSAKDYTDAQVAAEAALRIAADNALDGRLDAVETKLTNVSNVMDFVGAKSALPAEGSNQSGDVIVITEGDDAGKEFVYDDTREAGKKWVEFGSTSATDSAVADLQDRMEAAEEDIGENAAAIVTLGTNKLDKTVYETYISGKSMSDAELKKYAEDEADAAQSAAETEAARLDGVLETTLIGGDTDTTYGKTIKGAKDYAKAYADSLAGNYDEAGAAGKAEQNAKDYADAQDVALKAAIEGGTITGDTTAKTIEGAKKYAEAKAEAARSSAVSTAASDATEKANAAKTDLIGGDTDTTYAKTIKGAKDFATAAANAAKSDLIGGDTDTEYAKTIKGAKDYAKAYADAQDVTTLNAAKTYADGVAADAVKNNIKAGNTDIVITRPTSGEDTGKTVISHKEYGTGAYTAPATVQETHFVTGINVSNGHVTGASVKSLAEALSAMTFIFDGGNSGATN